MSHKLRLGAILIICLHNIGNLDLIQAVINTVIYTGKIKINHSKYHVLSNIIQNFFISIFNTSIVKRTFFLRKNQVQNTKEHCLQLMTPY